MARIAGVDIPREKRVEVALTYIYGIGLPTSQKILAQTNINPDTRVRDLTEEQVNRLRELIDRRYKVEGDLRREVALNIKRLIEIGSYRGCATGATCRSAASAPRPTPASGADRRRRSASGARSKGTEHDAWPNASAATKQRRRERRTCPRGTSTSRRRSTTRSSRSPTRPAP